MSGQPQQENRGRVTQIHPDSSRMCGACVLSYSEPRGGCGVGPQDGEQAPTRLPHSQGHLSVSTSIKWEGNIFPTPPQRDMREDVCV